jgi:hypothetical protein
MSAMNRDYLKALECGKPQLYGRAVDTVQALASYIVLGCSLEKLYFNQDGIKRSGVAQVCKFFRSKYVNVASLLPEFRPIKVCAHYAMLHGAVNSGSKKYIAARVEDANLIAIHDAAWTGIIGIHFE